jgi:hypothetical protein
MGAADQKSLAWLDCWIAAFLIVSVLVAIFGSGPKGIPGLKPPDLVRVASGA